MTGIRPSKSPKRMPTRIRVRMSIPLIPMPMAPAKLLSPTEMLTSTRLSRDDTAVTIWAGVDMDGK
jgi:hypothetical protein